LYHNYSVICVLCSAQYGVLNELSFFEFGWKLWVTIWFNVMVEFTGNCVCHKGFLCSWITRAHFRKYFIKYLWGKKG